MSKVMARPIEATPHLTGTDAASLRASLENVAPREEISRRRELAAAFLSQVTKPKPARDESKR